MMVDITPGDSGANKGFWRFQLRDRYGKFVKMGGAVMFEIQLDGVQGKSIGVGYFIGNLDMDTARIEVRDNKKIPKGVYLVKRDDITAIKAVLPEEYVEEKLEEVSKELSPDLSPNISGDEALKIRMKSVAKALKAEGRFPIPRQGALTEIGKTSDISKGARLDYQKVFDAEPALQERFKTFENMWNYVYTNGTDLTTQSPNDLAEIPEDMKLLNRAYAKHVLNLDPDGFLTVYRNAVNGKDTESESAVGYVSLDRQMAWDYNSTRENIGANGRYEIDVKPDEVYGLLGYSRIEDEYGLTIGRGVTEQEGRVRRVGDLEPAKLAPWLEEWNNSFKRQQGSSPLRGFGVAGEYDFHEVEDFGENLQDFLAKHNLESSDISAKFDQLYGEGSYARYKESGNTVNYALVRKMFVKLDNGNLGLNAEYLDSFATLKPNAEYKDDQFDNVMKMLSLFQELTGQPFMTHKTRDYTSPAEAQKKALEDYASGELALDANTYLRTGESYFYPKEEGEPESVAKIKDKHLEELKQKIEDLSSAFNGATLTEDMTLYRSLDDPSFGFAYDLKLKDGEALDLSRLEGTTYTDKGFMSTTKDADFSYSSSPIRLKINAKAGQKAIDLLEATQFDALQREQEVIFPAGSKFKISKASYNSDEGKYYIEMDYLDSTTTPDYSLVNYEPLDFSEISMLDESTPEKRKALMYYAGDGEFIQDVGHHKINTWLRSGEHYPSVKTPEEEKSILEYIDKLQEVVNSSIIDKDIKVYRYQNFLPSEFNEVGAIWTSDGFLSTSAATLNGKEVITAFTYSPVVLEINIPKGSRGGAVDGSVEAEVLLPPGSKFIVQSVEKISFNDVKVTILLVGQDE